jgi:hypothetical protein
MKSKTSRVGVMALPRRKVGVRQAERIGYTYHAPKIINVPGKRVAQASESRTPPTLRTSMSVYLNNVII